MELDAVISVLQGWLFLIIIFGLALGYVTIQGRQHLINLMMGIYLALLLLHLFPYKDLVAEKITIQNGDDLTTLVLFVIFTIFSSWLFARLMPREYLEKTFESFGVKLLLSFAATVLVMTLVTHYLPVSTFIDTGTPLPPSFLAENLAFLWIFLPLAILFVV